MLKNSILPRSIKKILAIIIILNILTYICISLRENSVYAAQTKENYSSKIENYPGYAALIQNLKAAHPNWNFTLFYTGLDWNTVVHNESEASHTRNVVPISKDSYWACSCGRTIDGGKWKCASKEAVAYYMDPRNWLTENYIFEFEDLSYNSQTQTIDGVRAILSGTWMSADSITYTKTNGTVDTINKSYAQVIMEAAAENNVSPYHLASRIKQEQGTGASSTASGTYGGYVGYYNLFNIGATGSDVTGNALKKAQDNGWTNPELSIIGGARFLGEKYISIGQSTLYLQKFDVDNSDGSTYWHQYMQNATASITEGASMKSAYANLGMLDYSFNFVIPVYENMPTYSYAKIKGTGVGIRNVPGTTASVRIYTTNDGVQLTVLDENVGHYDGYDWAKVIYPGGSVSKGTIGYIATKYLTKVEGTGSYPTVDTSKNNGFKIESDKLVCEPNTTGSQIKTKHATAVITNASGTAVADTDLIGTGYKVNIDGTVYTVVKLGDANGDGQINTGDTYLTKLAIVGNKTLEGIWFNAADVNRDGAINTGDSFLLKKQVMNIQNISL